MKSERVMRNTASGATTAALSEVAEQELTKRGPTAEEIRTRAYEIHIERGGIHGCDLDDWMQAERELQEKYESDSKKSQSE